MNYGLDFFKKSIIFRPHNIYGPNMGFKHVLPQIINKVKYANDNNLKTIELVGDGSETRAFCYIDDLIDGLLLLMYKGDDKQIYHIGNDHEIEIKELANIITENINENIIVNPGKFTHLGGTPRRCQIFQKLNFWDMNLKLILKKASNAQLSGI